MPLWLLTASPSLHVTAAPMIHQVAAPTRQQASPVMLLRDQTGGGTADGFRYDAYGGMGQEGGRYEAHPRYGKGCDAGPKTWLERGGWAETRGGAAGGAAAGGVALQAAPQRAAMPPAPTSEDAAKAAWLAKQGIPARGRIVPTGSITQPQSPQQPVAAAATRRSPYNPPDEAEFRYGPGRVNGHDMQTWRTGGP